MTSQEQQEAYVRAIEQARNFVAHRKAAYARVFNIHAKDGEAVLADLAEFCRAHISTYDPEARLADRLDGRREVWLRIQQHLQLTNEQLWKLYRVPNK